MAELETPTAAAPEGTPAPSLTAASAVEPTTATEPTETASQETPVEAAPKPEAKPEADPEKRIRDTQAWAHKTAAEKAEIQRKYEELEAKHKALESKPRPFYDPDFTEKYRAKVTEALENGDVNTLKEALLMSAEAMDAIREERARTHQQNEAFRVRAAHSDIDEIADSDDFHLWMRKQPPHIRQLATATADDQIQLLNFYKSHRAEAAEKAAAEKAKQDAAAQALGGPSRGYDGKFVAGKKSYTRAEIAAMDVATYRLHEKHIDAALKAGRVTE